ncbi:MAG: EVE domain-containing protein [Candidatus Brockarchaeota archaeon]|nr:EVE domain-containing protein [Candidatus Brockarchaeota archaeon]
MNVWIVTGSPLNLKTSLQKARWGVNKRLKNSWEKVFKGDLLLFYVTSPVCGIVGVASVEGKAEENNILWHDEAVVGRAIYPYRIIFKPLFILDEEKWETDKIVVKDLNVSVRAGLNSLRNPETVEKLLDRVRKSWGIKV